MAARRRPGDNGTVKALSRQAWAIDVALAVAVTVAAVGVAIAQTRHRGEAVYAIPGPHGGVLVTPQAPSGWLLIGIALTTAPLAFRRRYPAAAFAAIFAAVLAAHNHVTTITFGAVIFAAYSAVLYSRFRWAPLLAVGTGAVIATAVFPDTTPQVPARFTALLVLAPTAAVAVGMRGWRQRAGDSAERLLRAEAEHEAQTRRAVEAERARIAGELHDVVTHNVSVMVVQAGAARVPALVERVRAAGLSVELSVTGARDLPPGVDLAAYRVVQEALTNVIKHAGAAGAAVTMEYRPDDLLITVTDDGRPAGPVSSGTGGRGLIGLRERIALYGGELDAGPRPGGGWRVRARIPLEGSAGLGEGGDRGGSPGPVRPQFLATPR